MSRGNVIAAIATAPGRAAIGIVRLSGANLPPLARAITGLDLCPRVATLAPFLDGGGRAIDRGIALLYSAPHSYTGEDVIELQGHGGPVVLQMLLQRCMALGARPAEPGEFTQRAFLNGKLDLVQAEGVIDLIDAATAQAARGAMRSLQGDFSRRLQAISERLIELRARIEAGLDFPEEEIEMLDGGPLRHQLEEIRSELDDVLAAAQQGSVLREGLRVVLAGRPNVGKSSLLNCLAGDEVAIVTDVPGTTRDPVHQQLEVAGIPIRIVDTAGLRDADDVVERIGVERARVAIRSADAVLLIADARCSQASESLAEDLPRGIPCIHVMNKIDLAQESPRIDHSPLGATVWLSALTGAGIDLLKTALESLAGASALSETSFLARERHLAALREAQTHLALASRPQGGELLAEELRLAHRALISITGEFSPDDLLGEIFSRFCIGK